MYYLFQLKRRTRPAKTILRKKSIAQSTPVSDFVKKQEFVIIANQRAERVAYSAVSRPNEDHSTFQLTNQKARTRLAAVMSPSFSPPTSARLSRV